MLVACPGVIAAGARNSSCVFDAGIQRYRTHAFYQLGFSSMFRSQVLIVCVIALPMSLWGCGTSARNLALNSDLARTSLEKAMKAWVDGKKPSDLKPEIIISDASWSAGTTLVSFEIKKEGAYSDGTNLTIPVVRELRDTGGKVSKSETIYVVGTSPVITIFPQE